MMTTRYAKPENLVKVAATKDAEGHVSIPDRMQSASFQALVRCGWVAKGEVPAPAGHWRTTVTVYTITPKDERTAEIQAIVEGL